MRHRSTVRGLLAVAGVWVTAGMALPLVNVLTSFTPEQLLAARGFLTALMAAVVLRGRIMDIDRWTICIALVIPFASLGLFKGIRAWGAGPTLVLIAATPVVNFLITVLSGKLVPRAAIIGLALIVLGVSAACFHGARFSLDGLLWSVFGTICNGILYEFFARTRSAPLRRCFWGSLGIGAIGLLGSIGTSWSFVQTRPSLILALLGFAFIGGFVYWLANLYAFDYLPKDVASVLLQGETPAVIAMSYVLVGEVLSLVQWGGVLLTLYGAWYLSRRIEHEATPAPTLAVAPSS